MKKIMISQSNYIPWKGFFDSMAQVDIVVLYDDMQYTKRDWRNRNIIKTPQGLKWLSIPVEVKGKFFQKINETKISDSNWNIAHLNQLRQNYKSAKCFKEIHPWIEDLYMNCHFDHLSEINRYFIENINEFLEISVKLLSSNLLELTENKTERLVNICKNLGATSYYSGPAAKEYMEEEKFTKENIKINYFDYSGYDEYDQLYGDFSHSVTIFDLIYNEGNSAKYFLKKYKK